MNDPEKSGVETDDREGETLDDDDDVRRAFRYSEEGENKDLDVFLALDSAWNRVMLL